MSTTASTFNWNPAELVDSVARGFKNMMFGSGIEDRKLTVSWVEILPYGFVSNNYFRFASGNLEGCKFQVLEDGSRIIKFADGAIMVEARSGHLIELDKRRRVVLVKVLKSEAEGARLSLGRADLCDAYQATKDKNGHAVIVMPGNILIRESSTRVELRLPNGYEFSASKVA